MSIGCPWSELPSKAIFDIYGLCCHWGSWMMCMVCTDTWGHVDIHDLCCCLGPVLDPPVARSNVDVDGPCYHRRPSRSHADVHGPCYHQKPYWCVWPRLPSDVCGPCYNWWSWGCLWSALPPKTMLMSLAHPANWNHVSPWSMLPVTIKRKFHLQWYWCLQTNSWE